MTAEHHDARTREDLERLAAFLAPIIVSKRTPGDTLAKPARTDPFSVAAEVELNLMPPRHNAAPERPAGHTALPAATI